jgi:hypothetical protein
VQGRGRMCGWEVLAGCRRCEGRRCGGKFYGELKDRRACVLLAQGWI